MKRGANSSALTKYESAKKKSKAQEDTSQTSAFDIIPNEVFNHIISYLPSYCLFGSNSIGNVCSLWNNNIKLNQITSGSIVESCRSKEDAISILKDENLCKNLSLDDYIKIICWIPEVIGNIIKKEDLSYAVSPKQDERQFHLSIKHVIEIGAHSKENFNAVIAQIEECKLISPFASNIIYHITKRNPKLVEQNIPWELLNNIDSNDIVKIGTNILEVANHLYDNKFTDMDIEYALRIMEAHESIAEKEIKDHGHELRLDDLIVIASYHDKTADILLESPDYKDKLSFVDEVKLARGRIPQLEAAFKRQQKPANDLIRELGEESGWNHSVFAYATGLLLKHIDKTKSSIESDLLTYLVLCGVVSEECAKQLISLDSEALDARSLVALGEQHASVAEIIVNTPKLISKLNMDKLVAIALNHETIAMHILVNAGYQTMLSGIDLALLGSKHTSVACKIFANPLFCEKIDSTVLYIMVRYNKETALCLLKSQYEFLFKRLDVERITKLCENDLKFCLALLKNKRLGEYHDLAKAGIRYFADTKPQEFNSISSAVIDKISDMVKTENLTRFKSLLQSIYQEVEEYTKDSNQRLTHKMP